MALRIASRIITGLKLTGAAQEISDLTWHVKRGIRKRAKEAVETGVNSLKQSRFLGRLENLPKVGPVLHASTQVMLDSIVFLTKEALNKN